MKTRKHRGREEGRKEGRKEGVISREREKEGGGKRQPSMENLRQFVVEQFSKQFAKKKFYL